MADSNLAVPRWALYHSVAYLGGKGVTFGSALLQPLAQQLKKYSLNFDCIPSGANGVDDEFKILSYRSLDHVLITRRLESVNDPDKLIRELSDKIRIGGHLTLVVPIGYEDPGVCKLSLAELTEWVADAGRWQIKAIKEQDGWAVMVYKRVDGKRGIEPSSKPQPTPRACICRYGAIGDMIMVTPLIKQLKQDGYHVTLNITPYCASVVEHNPHVDNVILQEKDAIPNHELGEYWKYWSPQYDRYINLSESIEGGLLKVENRKDFFTHQSWRHERCNVNYYDRTMALGGYPTVLGTKGELYFNKAEERVAQEFFAPLSKNFTVLWALNGSSHHKAYPLMQSVAADWLDAHPDARLITVGDTLAQILEFEHPQVIPKSGRWSIRQALCATKYVDLVIGPETAVTNAAGCYDTPKMIFLSHSSQENLTKYFTNCWAMEPDKVEAPCYPCHQLHYSRESCPLKDLTDEDGQLLATGPACIMNAVPGQRVIDTLNEIYASA